ncbi:hypothetical protein [Spirulina sp. 06S082]|uniref:hypothetical protein n=1 Tax=Spirulina sp. 06S082 TaxID=3110248 RepID=UPI002B2168DA|nr:hypothetical protein [Spirulina sp. 06S082]MEA5472496.1 hypothetical protein [Spirulina sp. 06S082]
MEEDILPENPLERFNLALSREQEESISEEFLEDRDRVAEILRFGFNTLIDQKISGETASGEKIESLVIQEVVDITPKSKNNGWINFKIVGIEKEQEFKIGVAVIQQSHGVAVNAGINRLTDYKSFDLTRGCLVRSKSKKIKKTWEAKKTLNYLVNKIGGEWVDLKLKELKSLIYLYGVYQQRERYQLSDEQISLFSLKDTLKNPLLLEILSNPIPIIEEEIIEDDDLLESVFTSPEDELDTEDDELDGFLEDTDSIDSNDSEEIIGEKSPISESSQEVKGKANNKSKEYEVVVVDKGKIVEPDNEKIVEIENAEDNEIEKQWFERNYTRKPIRAFTFQDNQYEVNSWRDFLITVCTLMNLYHKREIEKLLTLKGTTRSYVSKNPEDLNSSEKIAGTNLYIETSLGSNHIVKMVHKIVSIFEYSDNCITIELDE